MRPRALALRVANGPAVGHDFEVPLFMAKVEFRFEAEGLDAAGHELYRLQSVADAAGFDVKSGEIVPAPPEEEDDGGPSYYVPLTPQQE